MSLCHAEEHHAGICGCASVLFVLLAFALVLLALAFAFALLENLKHSAEVNKSVQ